MQRGEGYIVKGIDVPGRCRTRVKKTGEAEREIYDFFCATLLPVQRSTFKSWVFFFFFRTPPHFYFHTLR